MAKLTAEQQALFVILCQTVTKADASNLFEVGNKIDFKPLTQSPTASAIAEAVLENVARIDYETMLEHGPFTIQYIANGTPNDLICTDKDGDHVYMPSGVALMALKCANGEFPPEILKATEEEPEEFGEDVQNVVDMAIARVKKTLH